MIRVYHRTGRRSAISMPLWLAAIVYVLTASIIAALVVVMAAALLASALVYVTALAARAAWRRRS